MHTGGMASSSSPPNDEAPIEPIASRTEREAADELAADYNSGDRYTVDILEETLALLMGHVDRTDALLLDVGCGTGEPSRLAREAGFRVLAMDVSYEMLLRASALNDAGLRGLQGHALRMPLRDEAVDAVSFFESFHLVGDPLDALLEALRVVKKGGAIAIMGVFKEDLKKLVFHKYFPAFYELDQKRHLTVNELIETSSSLGLHVRELRRRDYVTMFSDWQHLVQFVAHKPFFGLRQLPEKVFMNGLEEFRSHVALAYPEGAVTNEGTQTAVILEA